MRATPDNTVSSASLYSMAHSAVYTNLSYGVTSEEVTAVHSNDTVATDIKSPDEQCSNFTFIVYVPIFGLIVAFGLIGNTLSFVVLQWERRNKVATFMLQALAMADNLFLITTGFAQIFAAFGLVYNIDTYNAAVPYLQTYVWPLVHITQFGTIWMTVLIAGNRYIAICQPFQAHKLCSYKKVRMQVATVVVFSILYNLPRFAEYKVVHYWDLETNSTMVTGNTTAMKNSRTYNLIYENILYCLFVFLGPLMILIVLNVCLIRELWEARKRMVQRQLQVAGEDEENNITWVMIVIMLMFVFTQAPAFLNQILYYILGNTEYRCGRPYYYFFHLSNLVVCANSATNFVVYCAFRRQFRERLKAFCNKQRLLLKHTDTWTNAGQTMSTYTKSLGPGDPL